MTGRRWANHRPPLQTRPGRAPVQGDCSWPSTRSLPWPPPVARSCRSLSFDRAPIAYALSAGAAVIYLVATIAIARGSRTSIRVGNAALMIELVGVLVVGTLSYVVPQAFPDKTVWSHFGSGYGYIPLVLPVLGLWWLRRVQADTSATG